MRRRTNWSVRAPLAVAGEPAPLLFEGASIALVFSFGMRVLIICYEDANRGFRSLVTPVVGPAIAQAQPAPLPPTGVVISVIDGDTVRVFDPAKGAVTVRILGIDTPETVKPDYSVGCWGPEAADFARSTLQGQLVSVVADHSQDSFDHYGRVPAYIVRTDGFDYSVEAARAGVAKSYVYANNPVSKAAEIAAAEQDARQRGVGLWGAPCNGNTDSVPVAPTHQETPVAPHAVQPAPNPSPDVYYKNCAEARDAGAAPILRGQPGYRSQLDGDDDGIACEWSR